VGVQRSKSRRHQHTLAFPNAWGGRRRGAGSKPKGERAGVSHRRRAAFASRFPVHVTLKLLAGLPSLRRGPAHSVVLSAFAAMRARGEERFRLVHYSVQSNHLHLMCEARDRSELSRALQSLAIRIAKRLNHLWRRAGQLFADRYHDHVLRAPREARNALAYVLDNARHHGIALIRGEPDPFSSARWIDAKPARAGPICAARTWLLSIGWLRCRPGE
jgi:hypothetical protein